MTYAFLLLTILAVLTMSVWSDISIPVIDQTGIQSAVRSSYERMKEQAKTAVKEKAREELHEIVDEKLE